MRKKSTTRRDFVLSAATLAYSANGWGREQVDTITWPSESALGSIASQTNELIALLNSGNRLAVQVRPGRHVVSNPIICKTKDLLLEGTGQSEIVFLNQDQGGLRFVESANCRIESINFTWPGAGKPRRSHYGAGLLFVRCTNSTVANVQVWRAPGGGIQFDESMSCSVENSRAIQTGADGIHFANSHNSTIAHCFCKLTGDDAIAIVDYEKKPIGIGFKILHCQIESSLSRGIAIVGGSNGEIQDCTINSTSSNGLHIEQDAHYKTRHPHSITVHDVRILDTGATLPNVGNQFAVNILRAQDISLTRIEVVNGPRFGFFTKDSEKINILNCSSGHTQGAAFYAIKSSVRVKNILLSSRGETAFISENCPLIIGKSIKFSINTGSVRKRLVRLAGTQNGEIDFSNIRLEEVENSSPAIRLTLS